MDITLPHFLTGALQEAEKKKQQEEEAAAAKAAAKGLMHVDPLLANTNKMIGDDDAEDVGRQANKARMEEGASGIDAALSVLNVAETTKSQKALYAEFEAQVLPMVKEDHPGLRLSQYKEKVFQLWKKSPENPANQIKS